MKTWLPRGVYGPLIALLAVLLAMAWLKRAGDESDFERSAILISGIPEVPNLSGWPAPFLTALKDAYSELAEERSAANLARIGFLYHANGFNAQARTAYQALGAADPANARWPYLEAMAGREWAPSGETLKLLRRAEALAPGNRLIAYRIAEFGDEASGQAESDPEPYDAWIQELGDHCYDSHRLQGFIQAAAEAGQPERAASWRAREAELGAVR